MVQNMHNMIMGSSNENILDTKQVPPGFKFDPTDEELVLHFLYSKLKLSTPSSSNYPHLIPDFKDFFHLYHPCQLHGEAFESCAKWYFYTQKTENRISENGFWKEVENMDDQPIFGRHNSSKLLGVKKCLVFYDKGTFKTGWFMQEYHAACTNHLGSQLHSKRTRTKQPADMNKWVLCRVQHICDDSQWMKTLYAAKYNDDEVELSSSDEAVLLAMDDHDQDEISSYSY